MRIVGGIFGGRTIVPPRNLRARPTTDFAKENLFNVLSNLVDLEECDILDLFSGTGSISYEFVSRGARSVTSVEVNAVHHDFIRRTAASFGMKNLYAVRANAFLYLKSCRKQFDIVFSDAPYDLPGSEEVIDLVLGRGLLREGGMLIFEHSRGKSFADHPALLQTRSYGSVQFSFFSAADGAGPDAATDAEVTAEPVESSPADGAAPAGPASPTLPGHADIEKHA